ncbi:MAG: DUF2235 domain-containing protein [Bacteroidota bacterium]
MKITKTYRPRISGPESPRNYIILMDGTWNDEYGIDGDGLTTNIVKLNKSLSRDSQNQITRYYRGVGNDNDHNKLGVLLGGAFGKREKAIRNNAYSRLAKEYQPGDNIYIFGFSRGAASARMLAAQIHEMGIPQEIVITTEAVSDRETNNVENRFVKFEADFSQSRKVNICFLGVWDTVGAFGIPVNFLGIPFQSWNLFKNMDVAGNVQKAVHLVAADETRDAFSPTLMNHRPGVIEEIWMPGVHSDVGGSYAEDQLAKHSLYVMIQKIKANCIDKGLPPLQFEKETLANYTSHEITKGVFHFHGLGSKKSIRRIHCLKNNKKVGPEEQLPIIHKSFFALQKSRENYSLVHRSSWFGEDKKLELPILYNPANLKYLRKKYEVDET